MPSEDTGFKKKRVPWNKGLRGWQKKPLPQLFKKGHIPWTTKPIGSEKVDKYGFIRIKVSNSGNRQERWRLKHHVIYEQHFPDKKISKTDRVIFLDGNKRNFDINNLALITISEQTSLLNYGELKNAEETKTILNLIRIRLKLLDLGTDPKHDRYKKDREQHPEKYREYSRKASKKVYEKRKKEVV